MNAEVARPAVPKYAAPVRRRIGPAIHWVLVLMGAIVMVAPLVWLVSSALKPSTEVLSYPPSLLPRSVRLENLTDAWEYLGTRTFINSIIFTVGVVLLQLALSITSGFALARIPFRWATPLLLVFVGTLLVPPHVTLIPTFLVTKEVGWLNTYQGLILPIVAQTGFGVFLFRQFYVSIPTDLIAAARVDGASWPRVFWSIALPLSAAPIGAYCAVTFLTAWNLYVWPLVSATRQELRVLPLSLASLGTVDSYIPFNVGLAAVLISTLPVAIVFLIAQRSFVGGLAGSVKG
jgi:ABC-type glycerol-3-phosphate transport system permease component